MMTSRYDQFALEQQSRAALFCLFITRDRLVEPTAEWR
jgi:hypothetical protein